MVTFSVSLLTLTYSHSCLISPFIIASSSAMSREKAKISTITVNIIALFMSTQYVKNIIDNTFIYYMTGGFLQRSLVD